MIWAVRIAGMRDRGVAHRIVVVRYDGKSQLEDLDIEEKIILKLILRRGVVRYGLDCSG